MSRRSEATGPQSTSRSSAPESASFRSTGSHDVPSQSVRSRQAPPVSTGPQAVGGASRHTAPQASSTKPGATRQLKNLSKEVLEEFKAAFDYVDLGKEGTISRKQFGSLMNTLGHYLSKNELDVMFREADPNGRGYIEFRDFASMMDNRKLKPNDDQSEEQEEMLNAFRVFDYNGNGYISAADLRHVFTNLGDTIADDEVDDIIAQMDVDGTGQINYEEFVRNQFF